MLLLPSPRSVGGRYGKIILCVCVCVCLSVCLQISGKTTNIGSSNELLADFKLYKDHLLIYLCTNNYFALHIDCLLEDLVLKRGEVISHEHKYNFFMLHSDINIILY